MHFQTWTWKWKFLWIYWKFHSSYSCKFKIFSSLLLTCTFTNNFKFWRVWTISFCSSALSSLPSSDYPTSTSNRSNYFLSPGLTENQLVKFSLYLKFSGFVLNLKGALESSPPLITLWSVVVYYRCYLSLTKNSQGRTLSSSRISRGEISNLPSFPYIYTFMKSKINTISNTFTLKMFPVTEQRQYLIYHMKEFQLQYHKVSSSLISSAFSVKSHLFSPIAFFIQEPSDSTQVSHPAIMN